MKKSLLTLGAILGISTGALAQGTLAFTAAAGINTETSNGSASGGWYTGNVIVAIYTIAAAGNAALANTINADEQSAGTEVFGINLIESDFTLQDISPIGNPAGAEAASQTDAVSGGALVSEGNTQVGTAATLSETTPIYYALVLTSQDGIWEGAVVMNNPAAGYDPSTSPVNNMTSEYPADGQNIILPVPEPTTLALAGLGGLSMLFLRRRKA